MYSEAGRVTGDREVDREEEPCIMALSERKQEVKHAYLRNVDACRRMPVQWRSESSGSSMQLSHDVARIKDTTHVVFLRDAWRVEYIS